MRGGNATPPTWAVVLQLAKEYNVTPWEFEQMCTAEWWGRMITYRMVENDEIERREKKRGKKSA
jgi:hypothetical protein